VAVKFTKPEWNGIEVVCSTFYDGQQFGELVEFADDDTKLSIEQQKELQLQKYTAMANEECYIFAFNKKELNLICNSDITEEFSERLTFL